MTGNEAEVLISLVTGEIYFRTTEKCGGTLSVHYHDGYGRHVWEQHVCPLNVTKDFKNLLCKELGCGEVMENIKTDVKSTEEVNNCFVCFVF